MKNLNLIKRLWTDSHEKQSPQRFARYAAMLIMLLTLGVGQMWAVPGFNQGNIYFDKSGWTTNSTYIYFVVGKQKWEDNYSSVYLLNTTISNTQLVKGWCSNNGWWNGMTHFGVIGSGSTVNSGSWDPTNLTAYSHYTGNNNSVDINNSEHPFLCTKASASNGAALTISEKDDLSGLNYTLTMKYAVSTNGGTATELTSGYIPADITVSTYKFTDNYDAVSSSSLANTLTKGGSRYSSTADAAHTAATTFTVSNRNSEYAFVGWYTAASGGTELSTNTTYTTYLPTANATIYARFNHENNHTVAVTYICTETSAAVKSAENPNVGEVTTTTFSAGTPKGFSFTSWTIGDGLDVTSGSSSTNSITVKTKSSGDYTLRANYSQVLTSTWYLLGNNTNVFPGTSTWSTHSTNMLQKASGHSADDEGSLTINVKAIPANNSDYQCKVFNSDGNHWWGWTNNTTYNVNSSAHTNITLHEASNNNLYFIPNALGNYTFKVDWSGESPVLNVTWPTSYAIQFAKGTVNGSTGNITAKYNTVAFNSNTKIQSGQTITLIAPDEKEGYTWAGWFNNNAGSGVALSTDKTYTPTVSAATTYYACYTINNHDITYTTPSNGSYTIQVGSAAAVSTSTTSDYGKTITLAATPATGYHFDSWSAYKTGTPATTITVTSNQFAMPDYPVTVSATFAPITYSITYNTNGGSAIAAGSYNIETATFTLPTTSEKTGYTFAGWYTNSGLTGDPVSSIASGSYGNKAYWAKWTPNEYTVSFNANGGTGSMSNQGFAYGVEENLQTNTFTKDGYHFDGWAEAADGDVVYEDGADGCRISSTHGATVTLYAHWTKSVLTDITFAPTSAAGKVRITATPVITPAPTGTTRICWTMWSNSACTEKVDSATFTATGVNNAVTFWTPDLSGTYYIRAEYKTGSSCSGGTELNSIVRTYVVASEHNVTIKYMCDGMEIASRTQEVVPAADSIEITAPSIEGYTFSSWSLGDVIVQAGAAPKPALTSSTIEIKALYDGVVIANYSKKDMIYFNNTLGWEHVYVYFYSSEKYWSDTYGTGAKYDEKFTKDGDTYHKPHYHHYWGEMERIEGTNVWRFDYQAAAASLTPGNTEINGYTNVVFTKDPQGYGYGDGEKGYQWFHETEVVRRGDFDHGMSMFVPIKDAGETKNASTYYNNGYWMNYPESSGYTLKVYYNKSGGDAIRSVPFEFNAATKLPSSVTVDLEAKKTYYFEVMSHHVTSKYYGNNGTMTNENNAQEWEFFSSDVSRCGITTTAAGDYKFNWSYANGTHGYQYHMEVDYPASNGDYRIKYTDTEHTGVGTSYARYSRVINKRANGVDTVSFFIATKDKTPTFAIEYITGITNEGVISWSAVAGKSVTTTAVNGAKVYNIRIEQDADGNITSAAVIGAYTGNYYIRTDCASSQWNNYRYDPGNLMTYSEYAATKTRSDYTHYFMAHAYAGTNVKFVIANDYSAYLTDTLYQSSYRVGDASHVTAAGALNAEANIRFMWDMRDNKVIRAYLAAAKSDGSKFLVLQGTSGNIADENGNPLSNENGNNHGAGDDAIQFIDKENWIYETTVQVVPSSFVKLYAVYNDATFYYYGNEGGFDKDHAIQLVTGSGSAQKVKVVYDFKTDRLVAAWQPPVSAIESSTSINADVMLVRNHQDAGQNIRFTESGALTDVKTVYGVMQFNRWTLSNRQGANDVDPNHCKTPALIAEYHPLLPANEMKSDYERFNYFISFPFDVKVGDIFGFGTYGRHWVLKYYDGKGRATNGYWADSESNWKYITNTDSVLHAYQGYLLKLSVSRMAYDNEEVWTNNSSIMELYFPSNGAIGSITQKNETIPALGAEYECTINRGTGTDGDRRVKDSYWRCIGVPSFADYSATLSDGSSTIEWTTGSTLPYLYEWIMETNHLQPQSTSTYKFEAMKAYLVQYAGQIIFSNVSAKSSIVARHRDASEITNAEWKLTLSQDDKVVDQAFVRLSDNENVTANFDFNQDLTKELNTGSNLYTLIGYEKAAANCLPLTEQTTIVPIGIVAASNGDYTFAIPEGTNGVGVTLIDNETGIRTILSALDYTVSLSSGTYNDRFYLEISPIRPISTGVEEVTGDGLQVTGARKVLIDGLLYIVKDGKVFDAQGKRLQ